MNEKKRRHFAKEDENKIDGLFQVCCKQTFKIILNDQFSKEKKRTIKKSKRNDLQWILKNINEYNITKHTHIKSTVKF